LVSISFPASIEFIEGFITCHSLRELFFVRDSHFKRIVGFPTYFSLSAIDIPVSVQTITESAFSQCSYLNEVVFLPDSHLEEIAGFSDCFWLSRIEIPSSIEIKATTAFARCTAHTEVIFAADSHLREIFGFHRCPSLGLKRRWFHEKRKYSGGNR
jgi:hypothetical protein